MLDAIACVSQLQSSRSLKGDHVPSFMILPIQRVPRYKLLLEGVYTLCSSPCRATHYYCFLSHGTDYLEHLPEGHPDVVNTKGSMLMLVVPLFKYSRTAALAVISETALHMNSTIVDLVSLCTATMSMYTT